MMNETKLRKLIREEIASSLDEGLKFHIKKRIPVTECIYRVGSERYFETIRNARKCYRMGVYTPVNASERSLLENFDLGEWGTFRGESVPLDFPMYIDSNLNEAEYDGKKVELGKPSRNSGKGKKYKVYVRNPKTGRVVMVTYGDKKGGLKGNWNDPDARASFAARHNCEKKSKKKNKKLTPGYWACRAHKDFGRNVPGRFW